MITINVSSKKNISVWSFVFNENHLNINILKINSLHIKNRYNHRGQRY